MERKAKALIVIATTVLALQSSYGQAIWRNYWTTNQNPVVYGTNVVNTSMTVAILPVPAAGQFPVIWVSDVLTTSGAGDFVHWDGTNWRTTENVIATTDHRQFIMNCYKECLNASTPLSAVYFTKNAASATGTYPSRGTVNSGGASVPNIYGIGGYYGPIIYYSTGTGAAGGNGSYGPGWKAISEGQFYSVNGTFCVENLSNGANAAWSLFGLTQALTTNYPTAGAFFLYDTYNTNNVSSNATFSATWTNNWIAVTGQGSSYSFSDTGLPVQALASGNATNRLAIILTSTNCVFYTNGVAAATNTTTLPTAGLYAPSVKHVRVHGSSSRILFEGIVSAHFRGADPVVLP